MNILSLRCDNLFMFKDFSIDFTYKKQKKNRKFEICKQDALFPDSQIFVKKRLLGSCFAQLIITSLEEK